MVFHPTFVILPIAFTVEEFWRFVRRLQKNGLRKGRILSLPAMTMMYLGKLRQNMDNRVLQLEFQTSYGNVQNSFWKVALNHASMSNQLLRQWVEPGLSDEQKNRLYEEFTSTTPYFQQLQQYIKDPNPNQDGTQKQCVFLLMDSTQLLTQSSGNMAFQKSTFSYKHLHTIILTNVSNPEGRIVLFTLASASSAPAHSDSRCDIVKCKPSHSV